MKLYSYHVEQEILNASWQTPIQTEPANDHTPDVDNFVQGLLNLFIKKP